MEQVIGMGYFLHREYKGDQSKLYTAVGLLSYSGSCLAASGEDLLHPEIHKLPPLDVDSWNYQFAQLGGDRFYTQMPDRASLSAYRIRQIGLRGLDRETQYRQPIDIEKLFDVVFFLRDVEAAKLCN